MKQNYFLYIALILVLTIIGCSNNEKVKSNESSPNQTVFRKKQKKDSISLKAKVYIDTLAILERNKSEGEYQYISEYSFSTDDFGFISPSELRLIRNEIFARHGYIFKSEDLKTYFNNQYWYRPFYSNVNHLLTEIEKENIATLLDCEKSNQEISQKEQFMVYVSMIKKQDFSGLSISLAAKFGEASLILSRAGAYEPEKVIFENSNDKIFIIYRAFYGCDDCPDVYLIREYDKDGNFKTTYELGTWLGDFKFESDSLVTAVGKSYVRKSFEESEPDDPEVLPDTIYYKIRLTNTDYLDIEKRTVGNNAL